MRIKVPHTWKNYNQHSEKSISVAVYPEIKVCPHKIDLQTL